MDVGYGKPTEQFKVMGNSRSKGLELQRIVSAFTLVGDTSENGTMHAIIAITDYVCAPIIYLPEQGVPTRWICHARGALRLMFILKPEHVERA